MPQLLAGSSHRRSLGASLVSGGAWVLSGRVVTAGGSLVITMLLARLLAPAEVGTYFLAASLVSIAAMIGRGGLEKSVLQLVAESLAGGKEARARSAVRGIATLSILGLLAVSSLVAAFGQSLTVSLLGSPLLGAVVPWLIPWIGFVGIEVILADAYRGFGRIDRASMFGGALSRLFLVASLAVWLGTGATGSLRGILSAVIVTGWAAQVPSVVGLWRLTTALSRDGSETLTLSASVRVAWPLYFSAIIFYLVVEAGLWIVSANASDSDVALYAIAMRLVLLVGLPLSIVDGVLPPFISELRESGDRRRLESVVQAGAAVAAVPAVTVLLGFVFGGRPLLAALYGSNFYADAAVLLAILSAGQIVNVLSGSCGYVLIMSGYTRDYLLVAVVAGAVTVGGALLLVGPFGSTGVAVATALGLAFSQSGAVVLARCRVGVWTHASPGGLMRALRWVMQR